MDKFWMVWNPLGNSPQYKHPSEDAANQEARRLAIIYPNGTFIVLEALRSMTANTVSVEELSTPF